LGEGFGVRVLRYGQEKRSIYLPKTHLIMKITVKNLGALEQAEFTLGELTILCGCNNTGKTYATYALFGFLLTWRQILAINIPNDKIEQLLNEGVIRVELQEYANQAQQILSQASLAYTQKLPEIFASPSDRFKTSKFEVNLDLDIIKLTQSFEQTTGSANTQLFSLIKTPESSDLIVTLLVEKEQIKISKDILKRTIGDAVKDIIFAPLLPRPFIASAERTGAAIFRKELNFARNRLVEELGQHHNPINPLVLVSQVYSSPKSVVTDIM
jgi:hypothetical protein